MIRFCCGHCAHRISVEDKQVGKRGKCPRCGSPVVVPRKSTVVDFNCESCGQRISVPQSHAGRKAKCPKCESTFIVPQIQTPSSTAQQSNSTDVKTRSVDSAGRLTLLDVPQEYKIKDQPANQSGVAEGAIEQEQESEGESAAEETESVGQRKLPWPIDIFLYPISVSGMVHLAILSFLPRMLLPLANPSYWLYPPIFGLGFLVIFLGYLLYCLSDCIRDSANGGRRAPNLIISLDVLLNAGELISSVWNAFVCIAVCLGPLLAYSILARQTDLIFWLLVTYGVLFLPMLLLGTVLFDSLRALNPILIIASMSGVLLPYCGLILLFFAVSALVAIIMALLPPSRLIGYSLSAVCIYLMMVQAHLLGRFYWRHQEKLNWEV